MNKKNGTHKRVLTGGCIKLLIGVLLAVIWQFSGKMTVLQGSTLVAFFGCIAVYFWESRLLQSKTARVRVFVVNYMPFVTQSAAILLLDAAVIFVTVQQMRRIPEEEITGPPAYLGAASFYLMMLVFCTLLTFTIGASRTMLFHDEDEGR